MAYLVTHPNYAPFLTNWFDEANFFSEGMVVFNLASYRYTTDGKTWHDINIDNL